jgi:hypothetical protein
MTALESTAEARKIKEVLIIFPERDDIEIKKKLILMLFLVCTRKSK